jgi:lipopolysaccharide export system protein LptC
MQGHALSATGLDANLRTRQVQLRTDVQGRFSR